MPKTIRWTGKSGKQYEYWIYRMDTTFEDEPGNYIFAKETSPHLWSPVYIGETESLKDRLTNHNELPCITKNGGTHIHAHTTPGGAHARKAEEADLLDRSDTPCNG